MTLRGDLTRIVLAGTIAAVAGLYIRTIYDSKVLNQNPQPIINLQTYASNGTESLQAPQSSDPIKNPANSEPLNLSIGESVDGLVSSESQKTDFAESVDRLVSTEPPKPVGAEPNENPLRSELQEMVAAEPVQTVESKVLSGRIYYAWPSSQPTEVYKEFDIVVFGAGIEIPINHQGEHGDKQKTIEIIKKLKGKTTTFGYVNLGFRKLNPGQDDHTLEELTDRIQAWYDMDNKGNGVDGIFFDEASPSYAVDYARLEHVITQCRREDRARKLDVFINCDTPSFIKLAPKRKDGSRMIENGFYFLEEPFAFTNGKPYPAINRLRDWSDNPGVKVCAVATCNILDLIQARLVATSAYRAAQGEGIYCLFIGDPSYGVTPPYLNKMLRRILPPQMEQSNNIGESSIK